MPRILGEPSFTSLHDLLRQLKANAFSVPCTLGGGSHDYVGTLLSPPAYASLSNTAFQEPNHLGSLDTSQISTQYEVSHLNQTHKDILFIFYDYQLMQRALIRQVIQAVDEQYIAALRNRVTG